MKRLIPDTIAGRTLAVLIIGLALSHAISIAMYVTDRTSTLVSIDGRHTGDRIAVIDRLVRRSQPSLRRGVVKIVDDTVFRVTLTAESMLGENLPKSEGNDDLRETLIAHLDVDTTRQIRVRNLGMQPANALAENKPATPAGKPVENFETILVSLSLPDNSWLNFTVPLRSPQTFWSLRFGLSMLVMLIAVVVLSAIVVHQLTRPLAQFARASQRLGVDVKAPPLSDNGPVEIRQASRAFNQMQNRIRRFVDDRTQMIAAISHDLGTPIARMRLRAEFIEDETQQQKMLTDLDEMEKMVSSALSFARDDSAKETLAMVDFQTLLQRVCDDISDSGFKATFEMQGKAIPYNCRPVALRRALSNLVENAARYGGEALVSVLPQTDVIVVTIKDNGPGIPEDRLEDVFRPFFRLEDSRSRETGGTGLGMTVARTIVRAHGGDIILSNRDEGGLKMEVRLPRL